MAKQQIVLTSFPANAQGDSPTQAFKKINENFVELYLGVTSIVTVGTITTGIWNGTAVGAVYGGTGQSTVTIGDILYGSAANVWSKLAAGASGYILTSGGAGVAPAWAAPAGSWSLTGTSTLTGNVSIDQAAAYGISFINSSSGLTVSGITGTNAISLTGNNSNRVSIYLGNSSTQGSTTVYLDNDRSAFAAYGGLFQGGSAAGSTFFGVNIADTTFLFSDGASSGGLGVGTLTSDPLTFGTNNTKVIQISGAGITTVSGDLKLGTAGNGLYIKEGSNATMGTAVANGTTEVIVSTTKVTATSRIFLTCNTVGGTPLGVYYVSSRSAGVSFGFKAAATDTSTIAWHIIEPA